MEDLIVYTSGIGTHVDEVGVMNLATGEKSVVLPISDQRLAKPMVDTLEAKFIN